VNSPLRFLAFAASVFAASNVLAQADPFNPPRNPIVLSIAGTNGEPDIYRDVSLTAYELLTGSLQFEKKDDSAKAVFAPFKLRESYVPVLSEVGLNFAQSKGITTFGFGAAYNARSLFSKQAGEDLNARLMKMKTFRSQNTGETDEEYDGARTAYYKQLWIRIFDDFYRTQASNAWIIGAAYNVQTFGILAGDKVDVDENGKIDNAHKQKGYDVSASLSYTWDQATGLTASGHTGKKRKSAVEGQDLQNYRGWSLAIARRVKTLNPNYRSSEDYMKSLFIPGVILGASYEWERCGGSATSCDDGLRSRGSFTPFFELKVTPQAQFRVGVPFRRSVQFGGKSQTELAPSVQYLLQLTGAK